MAKESRISVKVDEDLKRRLEAVAEDSQIGEATLIRAMVGVLCDSWEDRESLTIPFSLIPKNEYERLMRNGKDEK